MSDGPYPRVPWMTHLRGLDWKQGEHMFLCAPTGAGKSTLMEQLVRKRSHVVIFVSKFNDDTFEKGFAGWKIARTWKEVYSTDQRVLLWPIAGKSILERKANQRRVFREALNDMAMKGKRCIVIDELHYTTDRAFLGLFDEVAIMHHQGRSSKLSVVNLSQRPAWVPKIIYSSVSHAYIARTRDAADLKRLADLGGVDAKELARVVLTLPDRHDYVYVPSQGDGSPCIVNIRQ